MLLKLDPDGHRKTRVRFCRRTRPIEHVRRLCELYRGYSQAVPGSS